MIFSEQLKSITCNQKIVYKMDILRQNACVFVNPIMVDNFASLFSYMTAGRSAD